MANKGHIGSTSHYGRTPTTPCTPQVQTPLSIILTGICPSSIRVSTRMLDGWARTSAFHYFNVLDLHLVLLLIQSFRMFPVVLA